MIDRRAFTDETVPTRNLVADENVQWRGNSDDTSK